MRDYPQSLAICGNRFNAVEPLPCRCQAERQSMQEHRAIVEAIQARDTQLARQMAQDHIENAENILMESLKEKACPDKEKVMVYDAVILAEVESELRAAAAYDNEAFYYDCRPAYDFVCL